MTTVYWIIGIVLVLYVIAVICGYVRDQADALRRELSERHEHAAREHGE